MTDQLVRPAVAEADEAALWAEFAGADGAEALARSWLALLCRLLVREAGGVARAMLVAARPGGPFQPVAVWPNVLTGMKGLEGPAEAAVRSGEPEVRRDGAQLVVAYPYLSEGQSVAGAVVLELPGGAAVAAVLRTLHWGVGWLEAQAVRDRMGRERVRTANLSAALDLVALANEHERAEGMAIAVANELAARLGATRIGIGLRTPKGAELLALSHTAWFKRRTTLARQMAAAMDEAMDQRATIIVPQPAGAVVRIQVAHEALQAGLPGDGSLVTVPMPTESGPVGAILVLHPAALPEAGTRLLEAVAALLGPVMAAKRKARRWVSGRVADGVVDFAGAVAGPRHLGVKLLAGTALVAVVAAFAVPMPFRISAKAVLEGEVQRVVPAPFDGFIAAAPVHAGEVVSEGTVLASLDDKDLQLDRVKWASERERLLLKQREALAKHEPANASQIEAQLQQNEAQARLTAAKLARANIVAPIAGVVVSGDLSHSIGAPVETGKVLFEVAPLDRYRVVVRVDERDLRHVRPGERGSVLLYGMSGSALGFTVQRVTAVAQVDNGRNTFRVEGMLDPGAPEGLRPGMEGVGKIEAGRRSVAAVWTRGLVAWVRSTLWAWAP